MENGNLNKALLMYKDYLLVKKQVSKATLSAYQTDINKFFEFVVHKYEVSIFADLNQSMIMSYILFLKQNNRKSSSISRSLSVIKNFTLFCYHKDLIDVNLSEHKYEVPKDEKKLPEVLTVEEVNLILSQPENTALGIRDKAMLEILYSSGLKVNELINLKVQDLDMKLKILHCQSNNGVRILPLGAIAYDAIDNYLFSSRKDLMNDENSFLFLSYNGEKISRQGFWKVVKKYAEKAGMDKNISTSTFRHSFATHMIENGINKDILKDALGNSSVASVQMYLDLNRKRQSCV